MIRERVGGEVWFWGETRGDVDVEVREARVDSRACGLGLEVRLWSCGRCRRVVVVGVTNWREMMGGEGEDGRGEKSGEGGCVGTEGCGKGGGCW